MILTAVVIGALLVDVAVGAGVIFRTWAYFAAALVACAALICLVFSRPVRSAIHADIEDQGRTLQTYATGVAKSFRALYGRSCAFVLLATPLGESPAAVQYVSNLERKDGTEPAPAAVR